MASSANPTIFFAIKMKNHWVDFYSFLINSIEMIVDSQNYPMSTNKVKEWSEKRYSGEHKTMRTTHIDWGRERKRKKRGIGSMRVNFSKCINHKIAFGHLLYGSIYSSLKKHSSKSSGNFFSLLLLILLLRPLFCAFTGKSDKNRVKRFMKLLEKLCQSMFWTV